MANTKTTALTGFTPILTDIIYAVDDPGGTPISGKVTFQQAMDLMEANMTVPGSVSSAYRTSTILASTSNAEGAALIGVEDAGTYFAGANVEAVLAEIGALLPAEANATADQSDAEIETAYNNQVAVIGQAEAEAGVATTVRRFTAERIGQAIAALAATDNFDEGAGAPASAPSAVNRFYRDTSGGDLYYSIGTSTTADWILLFSATGGSLLSELTDTDAVTTSDHALFGDATASGASKSRTYANLISDLALALTSGNTYAGTHDFGGADDLEIPNGATPTVDTAGQIAIDTTVTDWSHGILEYFSGEAMGVVAMPIAQFTTPTDGYVVAYNATNDEFELVANSGSGLSNVVEDTTPQLGGMLDVNGQALGDGTLELLKFSETASAVNEITITNAATLNHPSLSATGDDADINLNLVAKGTGVVTAGGVEVVTLTGTQALTNKTLTSPTINTPSIGTSFTFDGVTFTGATGADVSVVSGTAGTNGNLAMWNADGDAVDSTVAASAVATLTGAQTLTNKTLTAPKIAHPITTDADNYTLVAGDQSGIVIMSSGSANQLTIPANTDVAFPTGTKVEVWSTGAGTTTIAGATGVTLQGNGGSASAGSCDIQTQYGGATLTKIATDTWMVGGDIDTVA